VEKPPRLRPSASASGSLFSVCGVLVSPYDRRVEHHPVEVRLSEGLKDRLPASLFRPTVEALVHGIVLAEALREVWPRRSSARNPEHRVQKAAVVVGIAARITWLSRKQQPEAIALLARRSVRSVVA
jgi:hypothetical protein